MLSEKSTGKPESSYDESFVAKILKSKQQAIEGKVTTIAIKDLWK